MNEKLKAVLEELRDELKRINPSDPQLKSIQKKTDDVLNSGDHLPLIEDLKEAAERFEARHPQLTAAMNNAMNSLSNLGI
jgi:chaperonin cofactor prefoldin